MVNSYQKSTDLKYSEVEWLEKIPQEWIVNRGKYLLQSKKEINEAMRCDNVLSLTMKGVLHRSELGEGGLLPSDYSTFQIFYPKDLVFKLIDLNNYKTSRVGIVDEKGIMSSAYIRIFSKNNDIFPKYYYYFYYNLYLQGIYNFIGMGVRSTMNAKELLELRLIKPPYETQKQIADFLDLKTKTFDQIIEKKKKLIELLKEKRISIITQAVTKGLDTKVKMKQSGVEWIGEIPEEWKLSRLRFLSKINPSKSEINTVQNIKVTFLPMPLVSELGKIELTDEKDLDVVSEGFTYFSNNDVIFAKITPCFENYKGAVVKNLVNNIGFGSTEFVVLRPEKIDPFFIYYITMTHAFRNIGELEMRGSAGQQRITTEFVKNFICQYPDLEKQKIISATILQKTNNLDLSINKTEKQIKTLLEYRSSLIYNAVTGKIGI